MASVTYHISNLLEKMTSNDKDFRFMATNDLMAELQKDSIKLDDDTERKVVKMLLKLLEDKNGEVQNLAVKCLGPLVNKVKDIQVETIVDTLCSNMLSENEQLRDISSIGLKTVISELAPSSTNLAASICKKITGRLTSAVSKQEDVSVQLEALDILSDLLSRFGNLLIAFHPSIQQALQPQLSSPRLAVRKRSISALAHLVMSCSNSLFDELIDYLLVELNKNVSISTTRTYIQCIGAITRQAGHRVGEHLERVMPLVVQYSRVEDDELREYCIQAFESFVRRCPKDVSPHIGLIIKICLEYLIYDPNYNYDDDDETVNTMELDDEEEEAGASDDEYSDDDDMSWKVRRAAAKCLAAVVGTRHEMLKEFYLTVSPALISRFKEREENVKSDIFQAFMTLLKQTRPSVLQEMDAMEQEEGPVAQLQLQIPLIVRALQKLLKEKSIKTRQGCFNLLSELVQVLPGALADHIAALIPGIQFSLSDKNSSSNMKIDTLTFVNLLLIHHNPTVFHPHINALVDPVVVSVGDSFYKITSEALVVSQQLIKVIRPLDVKVDLDYTPYLNKLYTSTLLRLKATDIDQEVKERAISCMGQIICNMGDALGPELNNCLPVYLDRLKNEITRLTTVKSLALIAGSPLKINLSMIMSECLPILSSFLRKNHRALRLATLQCLDVLVKNYGGSMSSSMYESMLIEIPNLISENDLHVSQLSLTLLTSICLMSKASMAEVNKDILPQILRLIRSPLLQGAALQAMLEFFQALIVTETKDLSYPELLQMLTLPVFSTDPEETLHRQAYHSVAKCIAALTITMSGTHAMSDMLVTRFILDIKNAATTDNFRLLALLTIGEIGKHIDLSGQPELQKVIIDSFSSANEEVKTAASYALGNVTVGNLPKLLPFVLEEIEKQPKRQYLLLHSLKEIISSQSVNRKTIDSLKPVIQSIWDLLMKNCECPEEGTRNVVAECLGKLALINPTELLPRLKSYLARPSAFIRSTVITAVKFTISDQPQAIDPLLRQSMGDFLEALHDKDLNVRRVALVAFNSAAHNKPSLIRDLLQSVLPHLYSETKVRKELIREVEMGPFKHTVDDGLDIRKAAFECMYTLLDSCLDRIDIFEFLKHVEDGLNDHYDIKMLTYLMLVRIANLCPSAVLQHLDQIVEPLRTTCTTKVKANSVKQEFEKQDELKRSAMRAVASLLLIPDADKSPLMNEFLSQIKNNPDLTSMFESVQRDTTSTVSEASLMDIS